MAIFFDSYPPTQYAMRFSPTLSFSLLLCTLPFIASCGKKNEFASPPPMPVGVQSPVIRDQPTFFEFPGHLQAMQTIRLSARVKGILKTISPDFKAGRKVKQGVVLFEIDDVQYRAAFNAAEASLAKAQADLNLAKITLERRKTASEAIAKIQIDTAQSDVDAAHAIVKSAEATVTQAKDTLSWCKITAPISGRISELEVDQFNLVGNNEDTELCTMVNDDSLRVYFDINERAALHLLKARKSATEAKADSILVTLTLANGRVYPHPAAIDYADVQISQQTGTVRLRAIVQNPDGELASGLYVKVKLPSPNPGKDSILIPSIAIQRDLGGNFVFVVTPENKVLRINIQLGDRVDRLRIVKSGLTGEEKIITQGFQRIREGMTVAPQPVPNEQESPPKQPNTPPKEKNPTSNSQKNNVSPQADSQSF